ncbi:hypothetical protein ACFXPX_16785 [Kitasatospora sp. NPDC059146]|uniref:hypothetical protein n=1 Tax=unclassified Kitasatospora TaxID=2633591 RepID=UPI0036AD0FA5
MPSRNRRLPSGLSWPLTATDVRDALGVLGAERADTVRLDFDSRPWEDGTLLHAEWIPPVRSNYGTGGFHPAWWSTVRVGVSPLPAAERPTARLALRHGALPELAAWIDATRTAPETWTHSRHSRRWRLAGTATTFCDDLRPWP